jgi:hypothetical protein
MSTAESQLVCVSNIFTKRHVLSDLAIIDHKKEKAAPAGHNKFLHYESPLMPLRIPVWSDALQAVNHDQPPLSYHTCYVFPEAALFASTNKSYHAKFFATWIAIQPACM